MTRFKPLKVGEAGVRPVKCKSGLMGWQARLRENYDNSFDQWEAYARVYGLTERLGYETPEEAWEANPVIQGSTNPSDFRKVRE